MKREILHVDVNNAFLSWTAIDRMKNGENLDIRLIPSIIGGDEKQRHGVVLAKSPIAKQFGIKTGEPIFWQEKNVPKFKFIKVIFLYTIDILMIYMNYYYNTQIKLNDFLLTNVF